MAAALTHGNGPTFFRKFHETDASTLARLAPTRMRAGADVPAHA